MRLIPLTTAEQANGLLAISSIVSMRSNRLPIVRLFWACQLAARQ